MNKPSLALHKYSITVRPCLSLSCRVHFHLLPPKIFFFSRSGTLGILDKLIAMHGCMDEPTNGAQRRAVVPRASRAQTQGNAGSLIQPLLSTRRRALAVFYFGARKEALAFQQKNSWKLRRLNGGYSAPLRSRDRPKPENPWPVEHHQLRKSCKNVTAPKTTLAASPIQGPQDASLRQMRFSVE